MSRTNLANAAAEKFGAEKIAAMDVTELAAAMKSTMRDAEQRDDTLRLTETLVELEFPHLTREQAAQLAALRLAP